MRRDREKKENEGDEKRRSTEVKRRLVERERGSRGGVV